MGILPATILLLPKPRGTFELLAHIKCQRLTTHSLGVDGYFNNEILGTPKSVRMERFVPIFSANMKAQSFQFPFILIGNLGRFNPIDDQIIMCANRGIGRIAILHQNLQCFNQVFHVSSLLESHFYAQSDVV